MPDKQIIDLPALDELKDTDYLVVGRPSAPEPAQKMQGAQLAEFVDKSAQPHVTEATKQAQAAAASAQTATTKASEASQSATQAQDAQQGAATAQDAAETARDQSVAAAGTIGDSVEQAQTAAGQASSAKDAAVAAKTAAETAKTAAETASGQAQTAATQAAGSATAAQTAATQAGDAKTDAETARNEAETSASSAANSASDAESAATEAEQAKTYIENMNMEGETLPAGSSVTVTKTTSPEGNLLFVIGVPQGIQGETGPTGASVDHIERTSGTGAPGTTDTYTVYLTDGQTGGTFQVYNGSNGTGSGDFMADGSVPMTGDLQMGGHKITNLAEPTDNTDAASKEYVDDTITVSLVGNYIPMGQKGQANGVASLDDEGKVPSAQLPPMDYVPTSRTVNGHALSADVTLDADDVGALPNPTGGTAGQVLTKTDTGEEWADAPDGLPTGGTTGQVLTKTSTGEEWSDAPSGLPEGGAEGQILEKTSSGAAWVDKPESGLTQEQADERYLQLTGGTVTGEVDMGQNPIRNVSTIFGGTSFAIRSGGSTTVDAFMLNIGTSDGTYISGGLTSSSIDATNITVSNVGSGDTAVPNKAYVDSKSPTSVTVTLTTSGWSSNAQTVTVSGVVASETAQLITPTPAIASQSAYYEAGIMCTGQAANSLTFTCQTVPTSNLTVYVVIQPLE